MSSARNAGSGKRVVIKLVRLPMNMADIGELMVRVASMMMTVEMIAAIDVKNGLKMR